MSTLVDALLQIKNHLSNKERWEENWRNNKVTGYSSGSLANDLGGLWGRGHSQDYRIAYACCAKAIRDLHGEEIKNQPSYKTQVFFPGDSKIPLPDYEDVRIVNAFGDLNSHKNLMIILDQAIRYAKLWIYS